MKTMTDVRQHNQGAWNRLVDENDRWTVPVSPQEIAQAKLGNWSIYLTPSKPVPRDWFGDLSGKQVLCLASGGGQQGPILAAGGAQVTVFDNSNKQLDQDRLVAQRESLSMQFVQGDMKNLDCFADQAFDLIFHPVSNCFVPEILPVWQECFRLLKPGGILLAGVTNPLRYLFDDERMDNGKLDVCHRIPYSDLTDLDPANRQRLIDAREPLEFGHTLEDQLGGQLRAGFHLTGFYETAYEPNVDDPLSKYICTFIATRAVKPMSQGS